MLNIRISFKVSMRLDILMLRLWVYYGNSFVCWSCGPECLTPNCNWWSGLSCVTGSRGSHFISAYTLKHHIFYGFFFVYTYIHTLFFHHINTIASFFSSLWASYFQCSLLYIWYFMCQWVFSFLCSLIVIVFLWSEIYIWK